LALLVDQPQAAIPADAVGQVNDQVPFPQIEERIDGLAQSPPRQPTQFATMEQLAGGKDEDSLSLRERARVRVFGLRVGLGAASIVLHTLTRSPAAVTLFQRERGFRRSQPKPRTQRADGIVQPASGSECCRL